MPSGQLGFPRLTDIGPFVTEDIGWVLDYNLYDEVWTAIESSDQIHFGPDPPVLIEHDNSSLDNELLQEQLFSRVSGEEYEPTEWEMLGSRFDTDGRRSTLKRVYENPSLDVFPESVKFVSQMYTSSGAMITFEFEQEHDEPVSGMMRAPVTDEMLIQSRRAVQGLPNMEFFEIQTRQESSEFKTNNTEAQSYNHPHFRSTGVETQEEMEKAFDVLIELSEKYEDTR